MSDHAREESDPAVATVDQLTKDRDQWERVAGDYRVAHEIANRQLEQVMATVDQLKGYVQHKPDCTFRFIGGGCSCGLADLLSGKAGSSCQKT